MRRLTRALLALTMVAVCVLGLMTSPVDAATGFEIQRHDVIMDVGSDGRIVVTETMDVHFTEQRHGIYVNIPSEYHMTWKVGDDEVYKSYRFPVYGLELLSGQASENEYNSDGVQLKIGSSDYYADEYETYKFRYVIQSRDLGLDGTQMLFMNIVSDDWEADTAKVTFRINMPKAFDASNLWFASPAGTTQGTAGSFVSSVTGNVISGSYDATLYQGQGITVQLILPNDYFKFPDVNSYALTGVLIGGIFAVVWATLFFIFGHDAPLVQTVEFHAPAGLSSAEVGYIIDGRSDPRDLCSLIIDWGRRGLITITQKADTLQLTRRGELEASAHDYERTMWDGLFSAGVTVELDSLKDSFYKTLYDARGQLEAEHTGRNRIVTKVSVVLQIVGTILLPTIPVALTLAIGIGYDHEYMFFVPAVIQAVCIWLAVALSNHLFKVRYVTSRWLLALGYLTALVLLMVTAILSVVSVMYYAASIWYAMASIAFEAVMMLSVIFMTKRTPYATEMLGKILGLRRFIRTADEDRLKVMVQENPYYFYDILPYAYAMGLTKVWNDHFRNLTIKPCDWYSDPYGHEPYMLIGNLDDSMHDIQSAMTSSPSSSSGGGSDGGGGGFSGGGGFGGSGGGSW
mgnify:CR=1 FL=1